MSSRHCIVQDCTSSTATTPQCTFHKLPGRRDFREKWLKSMKSNGINSNLQPSSSHVVCSKHFKKADFQEIKTNGNKKIILKAGMTPSIFPWTSDWVPEVKKDTETAEGSTNTSSGKISRTTRSQKEKRTSEVDIDKQVEEKLEAIKAECAAQENSGQTLEKVTPTVEQEKPTEISDTTEQENIAAEANTSIAVPEVKTIEKRSKNSKNKTKKKNKNRHTIRISFSKRVKQKKANKKKTEAKLKQKQQSKTTATAFQSPRKQQSSSLSFTSGTKLEAQDFNGRWHEAKIVEVDSDEREVLIHFEKNDKLSDEWIPMDSVRLRPVQLAKKNENFVVGEKCMARWNDSRKFPATVQRIVEDDLYEVLFTDGYLKTVRSTCITKIKQPAGYSPSKEAALIEQQQQQQPPIQKLDNILIPDFPKDGEWCCYWINDSPVGKESVLEFPHGLLNTVIVEDWRLPVGWVKHLYQRTGNYTGKWDTILVNGEGRKFRSRQELKNHFEENSQKFDPEIFDFCLHKKRAKDIGLLTYTEDYKKLSMTLSPTMNVSQQDLNASSPGITMGNGEVYVGAVKVKVKNNLYLCPDCDKTFRKENHLQIHIKHYHKENAELLGVCPNMTDLAYLRTVEFAETEPQIEAQLKGRKSIQLKAQTSEGVAPLTKTNSRSSIGEENIVKKKQVESSKKEKSKTIDSSSTKNLVEKSSISGASAQRIPEAVGYGATFKRSKSKRESLSRDDTSKMIKKFKFNDSTVSNAHIDSDDTHFSCTDDSLTTSNAGEITETPYVNEFGEVIKIVRMRKEEIINCICSYTEADGLMIQCELCLCWQHSICNGIMKESEVPEKYVCLVCKNPERGRPSMRFIHDQDWLYDGKLPTAFNRQQTPKLHDRFTVLQDSHTLTGNLLEIVTFLHSLRIKMNIASNKDHPKMYLWSYKWEKSPFKNEQHSQNSENLKNVKVEGKPDTESSILAGLLNTNNAKQNSTDSTKHNNDVRNKYVPREEAIDPSKCQRVLLGHIQKQQSLALSRLQEIEAKINALDFLDQTNGSTDLPDQNKTQIVMHQVLKDLEKMKALAEIHVSAPNF